LVHDSARAMRPHVQLRPDLTAGEAAALCTGPMERVAAGDLAEARTWLRYANASYYLEAEARRPRRDPEGPPPRRPTIPAPRCGLARARPGTASRVTACACVRKAAQGNPTPVPNPTLP